MATTATKFNRGQKTATATQQPQRQQGQGTMWAPPSRDQIAARAFEIYLKSGCKPGYDEKNWLQAEAELRQQGRKVNL